LREVTKVPDPDLDYFDVSRSELSEFFSSPLD
jgi:hypothetical protein